MDQTHLKNPARALHLAIDFFPSNMDGLGEEVRQELFSGVRQFATEVAPKVPTIWVSFEFSFQIYSRELTLQPDIHAELLKKYHLTFCRPEPGEEIVIKSRSDLFRGGDMLKHLKKDYPEVDTLIFTGGLAGSCVALSIYAGMQYGYRCLAITDLMFNDPQSNISSLSNEELVRGTIKRQIDGRNLALEDAAPEMGEVLFRDRRKVMEWINKKSRIQSRANITPRTAVGEMTL